MARHLSNLVFDDQADITKAIAMKALDELLLRAKADPRHIILAEGEDARVVEGAGNALRAGLARITLIGRPERVRAELETRSMQDLPIAIYDISGNG